MKSLSTSLLLLFQLNIIILIYPYNYVKLRIIKIYKIIDNALSKDKDRVFHLLKGCSYMDSVLIRSARKDDIDFAFERTLEAGRGMFERFLGSGSKEESYRVFKLLWEGRKNKFQYSNAKILEIEGEKLGLLIAYPVEGSKDSSLNILHILKIGGLKLVFYYMTHLRDLFTALSLPDGQLGEYYISTIALDCKSRGRGLGTLLIKHGIDQAKDLGKKRVSLIVDKDNGGALKLYRQLGFTVEEYLESRHNHYRMTLDI